MSPFFVLMVIQIFSPLITAGSFTKVVNVFQESVTIKQGDVLQCEITKTDVQETGNDFAVFAQSCTIGPACYIYHEVSKKCFSFKVRTSKQAHIIFGNTAFASPGNAEIILDMSGTHSLLRQRDNNLNPHILSKFEQGGIVNDREYRGFWISWSDDELLEIGRESETIPFLYHRFDKKLEIKYVGYLSSFKSAWIIHRDPKCPATNGTAIQINKRAESDCIFLT